MDWWTNELTKRATFFFKEKTTVHIKLKDKYAYNGLIKEVAENEFIIVQDRLFGEITLFSRTSSQ